MSTERSYATSAKNILYLLMAYAYAMTTFNITKQYFNASKFVEMALSSIWVAMMVT